MDRITIDADLSAQLTDAMQPVRVYDAQGRLLGVFRSEAYQRLLEKALAACPVSDEELRRRASRKGGRELKDILADLERRAS
jgi:hypothetical protein